MRKWYSLIDKIYRIENLKESFKKVKKNKGAPGIDGVTIGKYEEMLDSNIRLLHKELKSNTYKASAVRRVEIEKPEGGIRLLGVPTVKDRIVQQAVVNIIEPIFEETFHSSSYGYRPKRSQHQAVAKAYKIMNLHGYTEVVDMDLSKCFDTLDHRIIIDEIAKQISDGKVLKLIRMFLKSGVIDKDGFNETPLGSPQGGVVSPLLSNIYLNIFDQKMSSKGIQTVRFADDILIFAKDKKKAGDYKAYARKILEKELKLKVNKEKTILTSNVKGVPFLGFIIKDKYIVLNPKRIKRFKDKVRSKTKRGTGRKMEDIIKDLNPILRGWMNYYRIANIKGLTSRLISWIRRRLRMIRMRQWKSYKKLEKEKRRLGIIDGNKKKMDMRRWKNSNTNIVNRVLPNSYFHKENNLIDMSTYKVGSVSNYYFGV
jgi:RNA-directed DNA polymerase